MIVRLTGGKIVPFTPSLVVDNFCISFTREYSLEVDDISIFFGDVSIKFEQTQYQNETFRSLVQRYVFASTLQLSSEEKNQFILRTCSIKLKFFLQQFGNLCRVSCAFIRFTQ